MISENSLCHKTLYVTYRIIPIEHPVRKNYLELLTTLISLASVTYLTMREMLTQKWKRADSFCCSHYERMKNKVERILGNVHVVKVDYLRSVSAVD